MYFFALNSIQGDYVNENLIVNHLFNKLVNNNIRTCNFIDIINFLKL